MLEIKSPIQTIVINIECFDDLSDNKYVAWLPDDKYKGIVVQANDIGECLVELGKSLKAIELYRKNQKQL